VIRWRGGSSPHEIDADQHGGQRKAVKTVSELRHEFEVAIDDFLEGCKAQSIAPEKPASGKLMLRVPPETHGSALVAAKAAGKSLNQWATEMLQSAVNRTGF
jgi:predicted HicB family RNase H-like nuclease